MTIAASRGLGRLGQPVFWLLLILFILIPCASSLILAVSPQGVFAETRVARGEVVGLRLEPGGCHVFAEPADGAEPPAGRPDTAGITSLNRQ